MRSFFTKQDVNSLCTKCGLHKDCKSPFMKYTGRGKKQILIVGEAPGRSEDEEWKELGYEKPTQLIGEAGQLLESKLETLGIDLHKDCYLINSVNCRPPNNRKPTRKEINFCRPKMGEAIKELEPKSIWLLGGAAVESFYDKRFKNLSISRWRKLCIPDKRYNAWILPMFHPSYVLRSKGNSNLESTYDGDLKWAVSCLRRGQPFFYDFEKDVEILIDYKEVIKALQYFLKESGEIFFDYETTSLKPFGSLQKIWSMSMCNGERTISFPVSYPYWNENQFDKIIT